MQHVRIEGGAYFFKPNRVIVQSNVPVELTVSVGRSVIPHTLVIQAPEAGIVVDEDLSSEPKAIRFTPTAAGSYPFDRPAGCCSLKATARRAWRACSTWWNSDALHPHVGRGTLRNTPVSAG